MRRAGLIVFVSRTRHIPHERIQRRRGRFTLAMQIMRRLKILTYRLILIMIIKQISLVMESAKIGRSWARAKRATAKISH